MALVDLARLQDWGRELLRRCGDFGSPSSVVTYEVRAYPNVDNDVYANYAIISLAMSCNNAEYEIIIDFFSRSEWFTAESLVVGVQDT